MRQDIVDVLKTSHMDLVRALIGQPPFACWRMAHLKLKAVFLFRYIYVCTRGGSGSSEVVRPGSGWGHLKWWVWLGVALMS